jgi:hypothetical protein
MIDSFIQNGLNMMILYVICQPKSMCVPTFAGPSNSVGSVEIVYYRMICYEW